MGARASSCIGAGGTAGNPVQSFTPRSPRDLQVPGDKDALQRLAVVEKERDELSNLVSSLRAEITAMEAAVESANFLVELTKQEQDEQSKQTPDPTSQTDQQDLLEKYQALQQEFDAYKERNKCQSVLDSEINYELRKKDKVMDELKQLSSRISSDNEQLKSEKKKLEARVTELVQTTARLAQLRERSPSPVAVKAQYATGATPEAPSQHITRPTRPGSFTIPKPLR